MALTMAFTGELTVVTCWCGTNHAVPADLREFQLREHRGGRQYSVYCPLGHKYYISGEPEYKKLARQLQQERQQHDQTRAELQTTRHERNSERAAKSRLKKRICAGVCPCCKRSFQNLRRHMSTKHPEFSKETTKK